MTKTGHPTVDHIILVKMLVVQVVEGFRSVRYTCKQIQLNATYRWFLGIFLMSCSLTVGRICDGIG